MKIYNKNYYYGLGATTLICAIGSLFIIKNDNSLKADYTNRIQNMEYVKNNAPQKYINTLEELNKSKSHRIAPHNINDLWAQAAAEVKDSLELSNN